MISFRRFLALAFTCLVSCSPLSGANTAVVGASDSITHLADGGISFTTQPAGPVSALVAGDSLSITGAVVTSPAPVGFQWFLDGGAIPGATSADFAKPTVALSDAGLYTLVATNTAGSMASSVVHVVIKPRPGRVAVGQSSVGRPSFARGSVRAILALPDGGALIGGTFSASPAANRPQAYLVRVRSDGTTDTGFRHAITGHVFVLRAQADGKILVAGFPGGLRRLNADLSPDTPFNNAAAVSSVFSGMPTDVAIDTEGRVYLGMFSSASSVRRFSASGVLDTSYALSANSTILSLAIQPDDRLLVGGGFSQITSYGQSPIAKNRLARVNVDGTVDVGFTADLGSMLISDLLVAPSGRIFAAGTAPGLVELSPTDGTTVVGGSPGGSNTLKKIALGSDGRLSLVRSTAGSGSVSRLDIPSGEGPSPDPTFDIGAGPDDIVASLDHAPDGGLWLAGDFTTFDGFASGSAVKLQGALADPAIVNNPRARADVNLGGTAAFAVGAAGTNLAYQWFKNGAPLTDDARVNGATTAVLSISGLTSSDDDFYTVEVTGGASATTLTSTPAKLNVLGAPKIVVSPASVAPDLGATVTLAAEVLAAAPATYVWKRGDTVIVNGGRYSGATTGTLVITNASAFDSGDYTVTVANALGTATTTPASVLGQDPYTSRVTSTSVLSGSPTSAVHDIIHLPDGRTLLATALASGAGPTNATGPLVIVDTDHTVSALPCGGADQPVLKLLRQPDGKILVAGGHHTPFLARLNADLTIDLGFAPSTESILGAFEHLALDALGRIYVGGSFYKYSDDSVRYLIRLDGSTGARDASFSAAAIGVNHPVHALVSDHSGRIVAGLGFSLYADDTLAQPFFPLVRLTATGELDHSFHPAPEEPNQSLYATEGLAVDASDRIYLSSRFVHRLNGHSISVQRLLVDGTHDNSFSAPTSFNQAPTSFLPLPSGKILVGGPFTTPLGHLVRLEPDGVIDTSFSVGTGFSGNYGAYIDTLAIDAGGRLWAGGYFDEYHGSPANGLVVLNAASASFAITRQPGDAGRDLGASATFSVAVAANNGTSFRWFKNGAALRDDDRISGSTTDKLTIADLVASDAAAYSFRVSIPGAELASESANLIVLAEPVISKSPVDASIPFNGSASFTGAAVGATTLRYQWLFEDEPLIDGGANGVIIEGSTTPTLTITGATFAHAGAYSLRVTNLHGSATSPLARLTVATPPPGYLAPDLPQSRVDGPISALLRLADDSMLVAGWFTRVTVNDESFARAGLARFLSDGSLDPHFAPTFDGTVHALAQDSAGRVFIGGTFSSITFGATTTSRFCVARLTPELALDPDFAPSPARANNFIYALAPANDGGVYIGGSKNPLHSAISLARLDASGALDAGFPAPNSYALYDYAAGSRVNALLRRADGKLYVAGTFGLRLVAPDGSPDGNFSSALTAPRTLRLESDGSLLVGTENSKLLRLDANTGATIGPDLSSGHSQSVGAIALQEDGKVLSGSTGVFKRTDPASGVDDSGFFSFDGELTSLAVDASGRIWVGGSFQQYGGFYTPYLTVLVGRQESRNGLAAQTINFPAIPDRLLGATSATNTFTLAATSSAGLTSITFNVKSSAPAGIAIISGNTLTVTGAGTITVEANQAGGKVAGVTYAPAAPVERTFQVTASPATQTQTITFAQPAALTYGDAPVSLAATASSGLPVAFVLVSTVPATDVATLDDGTLTILGAGKVTVKATQPGVYPYKPALPVTRTITVNKAPLAVSFDSVSRLVRAANPVFIPSYSGFVNGDTAADLGATRPAGKTTATLASPEGEYPITFKGGLDANYRFVAGEPAFLTVEGFSGSYEALLVDDSGTARGKLELLVPKDALTYSGTLNLSSLPAAIPVRGNLSASDGSSAQASWTPAANAGITGLSLGFELTGDTLDGDLSFTGASPATLSIASGSRVFVQPVVSGKKQNAPWTGLHTLVLRDPTPLIESDSRALPLGAGHASVSVAATGVMTFKGKLADGTALTGTARPASVVEPVNTSPGLFRVFLRPYAQRLHSFLSGELLLETHPDQTRFPNRFLVADDGLLSWSKAPSPAKPLDPSYRAGFSATVSAALDPWLPPRAATTSAQAFTLPERLGLLAPGSGTDAPFDLEFLGGFLSDAEALALPSSLTLRANGLIVLPSPNPRSFQLSVNSATGALSGSFLLSDQVSPPPAKPVVRKVTISGTLRQTPEGDSILGTGFFLVPPVPVTPAPSPAPEQPSGEIRFSAPAP